jgi:Mn2+/Fe2+ NRAMP family transporter
LYTLLIVIGAGIVLLPNAPLWKILIFSQVGNGVWLPVVTIFILLLVNRRDLMGEHVNSATFNIVAWVTAIAMIILTLVLVYTGVFQSAPPEG